MKKIYIFITVRYPGHKGPELAKAAFQAEKKYPEDESIGKFVIYGASLSSEQGGKAVSIFEPKEGKERDALMWIMKGTQLYHVIEGVKTHIEIAATYDETLEAAGIQRP